MNADGIQTIIRIVIVIAIVVLLFFIWLFSHGEPDEPGINMFVQFLREKPTTRRGYRILFVLIFLWRMIVFCQDISNESYSAGYEAGWEAGYEIGYEEALDGY